MDKQDQVTGSKSGNNNLPTSGPSGPAGSANSFLTISESPLAVCLPAFQYVQEHYEDLMTSALLEAQQNGISITSAAGQTQANAQAKGALDNLIMTAIGAGGTIGTAAVGYGVSVRDSNEVAMKKAELNSLNRETKPLEKLDSFTRKSTAPASFNVRTEEEDRVLTARVDQLKKRDFGYEPLQNKEGKNLGLDNKETTEAYDFSHDEKAVAYLRNNSEEGSDNTHFENLTKNIRKEIDNKTTRINSLTQEITNDSQKRQQLGSLISTCGTTTNTALQAGGQYLQGQENKEATLAQTTVGITSGIANDYAQSISKMFDAVNAENQAEAAVRQSNSVGG